MRTLSTIFLLLLLAYPSIALGRDLTEDERAIIAAAVKKQLKDPDSAQFRWLPFVEDNLGKNAYCAWVNAKNGFGGYSGDTIFVTTVTFNGEAIDDVSAVAIAGSENFRSETATALCRALGYMM